MSYSSNRLQSKAGAAQSIDGRNGTASIVDQRACAAAHLQLKQKIADSPIAGASRSIKQLMTHTYAQGGDIHVAPGQERHLPHEAWHVAQQAQGGVQPTSQMKVGAVKDAPTLEKEADMIGEKAAQFKGHYVARNLVAEERAAGAVTQRVAGFVKPTMQMKAGVPVNDEVGLETEADVMGAKALSRGVDMSQTSVIRPGTGVSQNGARRRMATLANHDMIQRKPVLVEEPRYRDDQFNTVTMKKISTGKYQITSPLELGKIIYYDIEDDCYYPEGEDGHKDFENPLDLGALAAEPAVVLPPPTVYDHIGAVGKGVGAVAAETTLRTTGLITCVGWLLKNATAAYLTHIVVEYPDRVIANGTIRAQVSALVAQFTEASGAPTDVQIQVDADNPSYAEGGVWQSAWMNELVPAGVASNWVRGGATFSHIVPSSGGVRQEWNGNPIQVIYREAVAEAKAPEADTAPLAHEADKR